MRIAYIVPGLVAAALLGVSAASAQTFTTLHKFCHQLPCNDGAGPLESPLVPDGAGNYFGTAQNFGLQNGGTLYALLGGTKFRKLFDFPAVASPRGPLVRDTSGNLYGIEGNGASGNGGIFKLHPTNAKLTQWKFETIYTFCPQGGDCLDGATPIELTYEGAAAGAPYDGTSPLYGSTVLGGGPANSGTVFQLAPNAAWLEGEGAHVLLCANQLHRWPVAGVWPRSGARWIALRRDDIRGRGRTRRGVPREAECQAYEVEGVGFL